MKIFGRKSMQNGSCKITIYSFKKIFYPKLGFLLFTQSFFPKVGECHVKYLLDVRANLIVFIVKAKLPLMKKYVYTGMPSTPII